MIVHIAMKKEPTLEGDEMPDFFRMQEEAEKRRKAERDRRRQLDLDAQSVMSSKGGRRFVMRILELCRLDESVTNREPLMMAMLSGRRDAGIEVRDWIEAACPDLFDVMRKECRDGRSADH